MADPTYEDFFGGVLQGLGLNSSMPQWTYGMEALASITHLEGLNDRYNPVNSVVAVPGGSHNSPELSQQDVQTYTSYNSGIAGTIALYKDGAWNNVPWKTASSTQDILNAISNEYHTWGGPSVPVAPASTINEILNGDIKGGSLGSNTASSVPSQGSGGETTTSVGQAFGTYINDLGNVATFGTLGGVETAAKDTASALSGIGFVLAKIVNFFEKLGWIFNVNHFWEALLYIGGFMAIFIGIGLVLFGPKLEGAAEGAAKVAAMV